MKRSHVLAGVAAGLLCALPFWPAHADDAFAATEKLVRELAPALMQREDIPGLVIGVIRRGERRFFSYGLASKQTGRKADEHTLFELGSISKTFTATLGALAQAEGALSLDDAASLHLPELKGSRFDTITLAQLATYSAGGLPLQVPGDVTAGRLTDWLRSWRGLHAPGAVRSYSNPSIGLFGEAAARAMKGPLDELMEKRLFAPLGLAETYMKVPAAAAQRYATGYKDGKPTRLMTGLLGAGAYGVASTASDMLRFMEAHMDPSTLSPALQKGIATTHTGHYRVRAMMQGLGWEMYDWPADVQTLLSGNSTDVVMKPNTITPIPAQQPRTHGVAMNKTGSTFGFGAYALFVPEKRAALVMLANRNYSVPERIRAAHAIMSALAK